METSAFLEFIRLVSAGDTDGVARRLRAAPALATTALPVGATRQQATAFFFPAIAHYLYAGDTALHMAAAALSRPMAELLMTHGADCRARNRRGAEPLHYAADGGRREPRAQAGVIEYLISMGAEPNAVDKSGMAPLHRAVRTRSVAAVKALLDGGAKLRQPNKSGSTPLHLAVQNTGKSGSGSDDARRQQAAIIKLLLARGARPTDKDLQGKTVKQAATSEWIRELLSETKPCQLFRLSGSVKRDPAIANWMKAHTGELGALAQHWFEVMRERGEDVREVLHDGHPTACVADAAFAYVNAFNAHVNVGFFRGAEIADPKGLLEGTGKMMRHVKLTPGDDLDATALTRLVETAYTDMKKRVLAESRLTTDEPRATKPQPKGF